MAGVRGSLFESQSVGPHDDDDITSLAFRSRLSSLGVAPSPLDSWSECFLVHFEAVVFQTPSGVSLPVKLHLLFNLPGRVHPGTLRGRTASVGDTSAGHSRQGFSRPSSEAAAQRGLLVMNTTRVAFT